MPNAATYAKVKEHYLKTAHPKVYQEFKKTGELNAHLRSAGQRAMQQYEAMEAQMMSRIHKENLDYLDKVKEMEQIPHVVEEIVLDNLNSL